MLPGPDQIIACPKCKGLAKYMTLLSCNTFDARVWTDGKLVAPLLLIHLDNRQENRDEAYDHNRGLRQYMQRTGIRLRSHPGFKKADVTPRQTLYLELAKGVWDPALIQAELGEDG